MISKCGGFKRGDNKAPYCCESCKQAAREVGAGDTAVQDQKTPVGVLRILHLESSSKCVPKSLAQCKGNGKS